MLSKLFFRAVLLLVYFLPISAQSADYDMLLLKAQAAIFPKVVMLDKKAGDKLTNRTVHLVIVFESDDYQIAKKVQTLIVDRYKTKLGSYPLNVELQPFSEVRNQDLATAYFILDSKDENLSKFSSWAAERNRLVFSHDYRGFRQDVLVSVLLKEKTYIYLNKKMLNHYGIKFQPLFYKIVKILE